MSPWQRFGALALLAAAALYLTRPKGTVTTSEDFSLPDGATSYPLRLQNFAQAVARAEGFYVSGSIPQRANNPGNLKLPGSRTLPQSGQAVGITVFESAALGWKALHRQLQLIINGQSAHYNLDMTIDDMGAKYEADPGNAWARNVARDLGVSTSTRLWEVLV